ncbi:MAG TPA: fimbria/pilus periplasmic chaperone [Burkholderiales bacterium]|nr:fimbria/pilus periplasmic chaperone [Burkholderiales bacterium]
MKRFLACLAALLAAAPALGGNFGVSPIRVDLNRETKSAVLTIKNDDVRPLAFQVRGVRWTQDASGADRYEPTTDIVYFPQQLRIPPGESRVVRVGYKVPAIEAEQAFRVYIEELAEGGSERSGTGVAIRLRFGVPVFLHPVKENLAGELALSVRQGEADALVHNNGNVHLRITAVRLTGVGKDGEAVFQHVVDGWYLLDGNQRSHRFRLPPEACAKARVLRAEVVTEEKLALRSEQPLGPQDCD